MQRRALPGHRTAPSAARHPRWGRRHGERMRALTPPAGRRMNGCRTTAGSGSRIMKVTVCCVVTTALTCVPVLAPADDSVIDRVRACVTETEDAKRLACYDFAIGRSKPGQNEDLGVTGELLRQRQRQAGPPTS